MPTCTRCILTISQIKFSPGFQTNQKCAPCAEQYRTLPVMFASSCASLKTRS